jgi:SAM-dependent methyltransferase
VERFLGLVRPGGTVLDVACGAGRHLALGLRRGFRMTGIDRDVSSVPTDVAPEVELITADLEDGSPWPLGARTFDGVIVTNYLWRPRLASIRDAVAPAGVLIYETFAIGNEVFGRPRNPDFLLRPEELIDAVRPRLRVIAFEHLRVTCPDRMVQRIVAVGQRHPAPDMMT